MCSVYGWNRQISIEDKRQIVERAGRRGRDGWGIWTPSGKVCGLTPPEPGGAMGSVLRRPDSDNVVGNFRATPTTEQESSLTYLQPYDGIVHNGVIANDKSFDDMPIDSMVLPQVMSGVNGLNTFCDALDKIVGSYALAFFRHGRLFLAANYKPLYWSRSWDGVVFASQRYMFPPGMDAVPFPPYTAAVINRGKIEMRSLPRTQSPRALVACSGGLDSTTVAYLLQAQGHPVTLVHFLYGCLAEGREVDRLHQIAEHGGFDVVLLEMPKGIMSGSIVEGRYDKGETGVTGAECAMDWVSARNLLMLSMLTAYAESNGYGHIAIGNNLEESGAYPDNEEEFGNRFNSILPFAVQNGVKIQLEQPLAHYMKHEIVELGEQLGVPYELTWSCYGDGEFHCGECGPCFMRKTAFERNGLQDPVFK